VFFYIKSILFRAFNAGTNYGYHFLSFNAKVYFVLIVNKKNIKVLYYFFILPHICRPLHKDDRSQAFLKQFNWVCGPKNQTGSSL